MNKEKGYDDKKLVLFANVFPYGQGETYLETEIEFYKLFKKVYIISLAIPREYAAFKRRVGENISVIPVYRASKLRYLAGAIPALTDKNLYKEFVRLVKSKRFCINNLANMFIYFSRSRYEAKIIAKELRGKVNNNTVFYSYRFDYQPYTALLVKKMLGLRNKVVSRAHRYDLYENEKKHGYIPMREYLLKNLYAVYPCSDHGTKYLKALFPQYKKKVSTRFLGTVDHGVSNKKNGGYFEIVSCSNIVPVKRIDLLVEALSQLNDYPIKWTHYGDGQLMSEIKKLSKSKLKIQYKFMGNVDNKKILQDYADKHFDLFINVSSSEGLPVSIMEAISFGIPCIATDVGGTKEIIDDGVNGSLINPNITSKQLSAEITKYIEMDKNVYLTYRDNARKIWLERFNAGNNYRKYTEELSSL